MFIIAGGIVLGFFAICLILGLALTRTFEIILMSGLLFLGTLVGIMFAIGSFIEFYNLGPVDPQFLTIFAAVVAGLLTVRYWLRLAVNAGLIKTAKRQRPVRPVAAPRLGH